MDCLFLISYEILYIDLLTIIATVLAMMLMFFMVMKLIIIGPVPL